MTKSENHLGEQLKQRIIEEGVRSPGGFKGATKQEIEEAMKYQGVKRLPKAFLQFLETMGNGGLNFFYYGDWLCEDFADLKECAIEDMARYDLTLPEDAFVFFTELNHMYRYFLTDNEDDDPPVYQFFEGDDEKTRQLTGSLTEYFDEVMKYFVFIRDKTREEKLERKKRRKAQIHPQPPAQNSISKMFNAIWEFLTAWLFGKKQ
jgi:hypothetical protein